MHDYQVIQTFAIDICLFLFFFFLTFKYNVCWIICKELDITSLKKPMSKGLMINDGQNLKYILETLSTTAFVFCIQIF